MSPSSPKREKGKAIKLILEIAFFSGLMVFALIYILKDDPKTTFSLLGKTQLFPILVAIGLVLVTLLLDAFNITMLARIYNPKYHYHHGFINVCIGQVIGVFVKSGATLMQAYTFSKQEIKPAHAASILTMNFLLFQLGLFVYSLVMVIFGYPVMKDVPINFIFGLPLSLIAILALIIQFLILLGIILMAFWKGLHRFILTNVLDLLSKLHLLRHPDETRRKMTLQFVTYRIELKRLLQHKGLVVLIFTSNILKRFVAGIIPFIIFWSLGIDMSQLSFINSLLGTGYIDTISSFLSVGVPEVMFQSTFSYFLGSLSTASSLSSAANLLWRSVTFYFCFILGLISLIFYRGAPKKKQIFSNTQTIYDLELGNLLNVDDDTFDMIKDVAFEKKEYAPYLNKKEVNESFKKIKESIDEENIENENPDDELKGILEEQRNNLANIARETDDLIEKEKPDKEIEIQTKKEMRIQEIKHLKKEEKLRKKSSDKVNSD